jgi:hypothetical protein
MLRKPKDGYSHLPIICEVIGGPFKSQFLGEFDCRHQSVKSSISVPIGATETFFPHVL